MARHMVEIVDERRKNGPYRDLADLVLRIDLSKEEAENLILSGALDVLGATRPELLWQLDSRYAHLAAARGGDLFRAEASAAGTATAPGCETEAGSPASPALSEYAPQERLGQEEYVLALTPSAHPLAVLRADLGRPDLVPNNRLAEHAGREVAIAGILMASRRARTRTGEFMMFVSLEDEFGLAECVLFPETYQRYGHLLVHRGPYIARGRVEDQHGALTLTVSDLQLARAPASAAAAATVSTAPRVTGS